MFDRPDAIIKSSNDFLQACADVSKTWSRKLFTLYWDASTTLPKQIMLNIRQIQEEEDGPCSSYPGLRNLWIDFYENVIDPSASFLMRVRSEAIFSKSHKKWAFNGESKLI